MADQELRTLVAQGLQALKAGSEVVKAATAEIENDVRDPGLKGALQVGNQVPEQWGERIIQAAEEAGLVGNTGTPIPEAHHHASREVRRKAADDLSRDLGIIAAGQLALHHWIAALGTLRAYAQTVGLNPDRAGLAGLPGRDQAG